MEIKIQSCNKKKEKKKYAESDAYDLFSCHIYTVVPQLNMKNTRGSKAPVNFRCISISTCLTQANKIKSTSLSKLQKISSYWEIFATKKHDWFVKTFGQEKLEGRRRKRRN